MKSFAQKGKKLSLTVSKTPLYPPFLIKISYNIYINIIIFITYLNYFYSS